MWQLNDCWPVLSWALLDYHGFGKAGYYAVRRAFAPVLASFKVGDAIELWVTNDTGAPDRHFSVRSATTPPNRHFFTAMKDLERVPARLDHVFEAVSGGRDLSVRLRADAYAYFVHLVPPDERVRFSDNYLELEPGEERTIVLTHPDAAPRPQDVSVRAR